MKQKHDYACQNSRNSTSIGQRANHMQIHIHTESTEHVLVLQITGEVDLHGTGALRKELERCIANEHLYVVLNLAGVKSISSTGIGAMIAFAQELKHKSGELVLAELSDQTRYVLKLTQLESFFSIFFSDDDAIAYFADRKTD